MKWLRRSLYVIGGLLAAGRRRRRRRVSVAAHVAAADDGQRGRAAAGGEGGDRARWRRHRHDPRAVGGRCLLRARLRACAGPAVSDGHDAPAGRGPAVGGGGRRDGQRRQDHAHPRALSAGRGRPGQAAERDARDPGGLRRRRECLSRHAQRDAAAGVRAAALQPGAVAAGGLAGVGPADGAGSSAATGRRNCCATGWRPA